jgi:ferric-dicitrate binding protein FerR (iron transport regulator)
MKETNEDRSRELITKYIGNELNEQEEKELSLWLEEDRNNRNELENAQKIWELCDQKDMDVFNTDNGWDKVNHRIHVPFHQKPDAHSTLFLTFTKIAAVFIALIVLSYLVGYLMGKPDETKITASTPMKDNPVILADGTKVYLNAGAELSYPKKFKSNTRTVKLNGEAFFEVTPNKKVPFIIKTPNANIQVLGTSFNVLACNNCDSIQVAVKTGIVELSSPHNNNRILISKGNTGVYYIHPNKLRLAPTDINTNSFAWKTDSIIFQNSHLVNVTLTLERIFGEKIIIDNENVKNCPITAQYKDRDLAKILEAMSTSFGLQLTKTDKGYILTGSKCK